MDKDFDVSLLLGQTGEWLKGEGLENDLVISTRVRLARNLSLFPFISIAKPPVKKQIEEYIREKLDQVDFTNKLYYLSLHKMNRIDRLLLMERHLISREHAMNDWERGVAISEDETISIMVAEEDHLRMQVLRSGFQPAQCWDELARLDCALEKLLNYAFHPKFGYVTCCPTNIGTGLRVSVMVHLPALIIAKQIEKVIQSLTRVHYNIRGLYGEGTSAIGGFFQISNQISLGKSEEEIIQEMQRVVPEILRFERSWRQRLFKEQKEVIEDKVWRAYGILKNARAISSEETLEHLSALRLGLNLGIIQSVSINIINELFIFCQPNHLQRLHGGELESAKRDFVRARLIRERLRSC
jgi:protein arginine kinase